MTSVEARPLRIGVNALYLIPGGVGGTEIYLRSLLRALAEIDHDNRYFVFTNQETGADLIPGQENWIAAPLDIRAANRPERILCEQTALPFEAYRLKLDVLFNPGFTAPIFGSCPNVTVFHDMQHKRQPENFRWFDLPFWRMLLYAAVRRSRHLLADSEATRDDLVRYYALAPEKITVAPLGVDPIFFEIARRRKPERYLLAVSTLHPHKNLDRLIRAFAEFHAAQPEFRLVIAGLRGFHTEPLESLRGQLNLQESVRFTGWIPREELLELFAGAYAFFYPSTFEGFGLPVLEALASGVPTACSNIQPVSGIAGDAALQFDPSDTSAILDAMQRLTCDEPLRARLSAAGPVQAAKFSWRETARITLQAIRGAALLVALCFALAACNREPLPKTTLVTEAPDLTDRFGDGTPEFLRLDGESDRRAFRHWFTFLAESQFYRQPNRTPREIGDCAALIRFAYREALREHDGAWASELDLDAAPAEASVQGFTYPRTPLGAGLFRVRAGQFDPSNLKDGSFAQFADAKTLQQFNTYLVSRDIRLARPGDLLFYRQIEQNMPFHAMVYLGRSNFEPSSDKWIIYHTGPISGGRGEIRRPTVNELLRHPSPRWRPNVGNANFLGVFRWNILRESGS